MSLGIMFRGTQILFNQRSLAFLVLITGVVGGLLIVFSILLLCKYCLNRKNLREAEQMKLLYEVLNDASRNEFNRLQQLGFRGFSPLEPRRSNPLDRYQLPEYQWQIPGSKPIAKDFHSTGSQLSQNLSVHEIREHASNKQLNVNETDDEQAYLQVDPRCYVRQNSNASLTVNRKSETPRLEKGFSINIDTRPNNSTSSLSPYRQSSFDVSLASRSPKPAQVLTPTPSPTTQPELYYTPRGSSLSIVTNPIMKTNLTNSQLLTPTATPASRKNSTSISSEKKEITASLDPSVSSGTVRSFVVQREHEHSRSLEHSTPVTIEPTLPAVSNVANDKQSKSSDAVHLLRPGSLRPDGAVNRRTKSYEYADEHRQPRHSIAPPPIIIKIPDMSELVQAAQFSCLRERKESTDLDVYNQTNENRKATLVQQSNADPQNNHKISPEDLWRLRQSYELEEQKRRAQDPMHERSSPDEFSIDLLTSTSIDSAGAMPIDTKTTTNDDDASKYQYRRKSSSNLLLPPPEVRRQALRRTFEKRRSCINQSNARREQLLLQNKNERDDDSNATNDAQTDFSNLLKNLTSRSENSSFERSLETDFDMQSDTSSRGPNDQFTSIESSGNENTFPDQNNRFNLTSRSMINPQSPQLSPHQDDSGYKSLESQNSQNRTFSIDWMSADGAESVIFLGDGRKQQRSIDVRDLDDQLDEETTEKSKIDNQQNRNAKLLQVGLHRSYQEESFQSQTQSLTAKSNQFQQRSLSTNIPLVVDDIPTPINLVVSTTNNSTNPLKTSKSQPNNGAGSSINRTASKKRREFSKEKKNLSSNVETCDDLNDEIEQKAEPTIVEETKVVVPSKSTLQVRHPDLRRTKSDETRNLPFKGNLGSLDEEVNESSSETKSNSRLSSSTDGIVVVSSNCSSTNPASRQHLSPNSARTKPHHQVLHRSPSSTTSTAETKPTSSQIFRSQRGSISLDTETSLLSTSLAPTSNKMKTGNSHSLIPSCINRPRLKFSMVRDSTTTSANLNAPVYSMPITRDYSIDEKTNRIVNEFLTYDPSYDENQENKNDETTSRANSKRHYQHHHPHYQKMRAKTFEEPSFNLQHGSNSQQTTAQKHVSTTNIRSTGNKQRHHSTIQINYRKHDRTQQPTVHLVDKPERVGDDDNGDRTSSRVFVNSNSNGSYVRRANSVATPSPSIIITGDDSGS